jgi:hypothetical protein
LASSRSGALPTAPTIFLLSAIAFKLKWKLNPLTIEGVQYKRVQVDMKFALDDGDSYTELVLVTKCDCTLVPNTLYLLVGNRAKLIFSEK